MTYTKAQIQRIAEECIRQGIREGNLISKPGDRAKSVVDAMLDQTPVQTGQPQWWVVSQGPFGMLLGKGFGQDLKAAQDHMEEVKWDFWALVHGEDWQGAQRGRIDRSPQSVRKAA